jgi:hypothetical protein
MLSNHYFSARLNAGKMLMLLNVLASFRERETSRLLNRL